MYTTQLKSLLSFKPACLQLMVEDPATLDDMDNLDTTPLKPQLLTAAFKVSMGAGATVLDRPGA